MKLKRKLALLLVVAMCMTLAPPSAFADTKISPELTKTAQWIDAKEGTAKITLQTKGSPVAINNPGADVVVVMDYSGSMGYDSGITKQCGSTSFTKRGFFSTYYECNSCGATYEHRPEVCTKQVSAGINRWTLAKEALDVSLSTIIPDTKSSNQVAFVAFDSAVRKGYTVDATNKKNQILNLVNGLVTPAPSYPGDPIQKGTNYTEALSKANQYVDSFLRNSNNSKPVYVIFLSDGMPDKGSEGEAYKQTIKNKATVYTIGLSLDNSASNVLKKYASDPTSKHHKNVTDPSDLSDTFSDISTTITSQVTVKDVINQEVFDVVSVGKPTSGTASLALDGKTVIWTLDNFSPAGDTLEIIIKLNKNYIDKYQSFITNESAGANYVDGDGTLKNLTVSNTAPSNEKPVIERSKTQYAVKFYHEDGTTQIGATQLIDSGSAAVMPEGPTKAETASTIYTFAGWVPVDEHAGYTIENIENVTRAMSFKAVFTAREKEKFIVSYNANGGIGTMTSDTAYVGSQITVRANEFTAPANSQFNGWKDASGRNIEVGSLLTENTVLTAQWRLLEEVPGVKAKGYEGIYDGIGHGITVTAPEGAKVEYRVNGADWTEANPKYINATEGETVQYRVSMNGYKPVEGSADVKIAKKPITVETGSLEKVYDGTPLTGSTAMVKGLAASDEGKITAAATGSIINAGSTANTAAVNGDAELLKNYTVLERLGTLTVTAKEATITVKSASKNYGENDPEFEGTVNGLINESDLGTVVYTRTNASVNAVGNYEGVLTAEYTENGNYKVTVTPADFEIKALDMSVTAEGYEGIYDGKTHGITVNAPEGAEITFEKGNEFTDAGNYTVNYKVTKEGHKTVEGSAEVSIEARSITLTAKSAELDWTGEKLNVEAPGYDITKGSLAEGQSITNVVLSEGQSEAGEYTTTVSHVEIGTFTGNYDIQYVDGKLIIKQLDMSAQVKAEGYEGIYDGMGHGITVTAPEGAKIEYRVNGADWTEANPKYINATEGETVQYRVSMNGYKPVEGSADVKIAKKPITVETGSLEKVYDGTPLTGSTAMVKGLAASDEGKITAAATGSIINAGSTANTAAVNGDAELLKNYTVLEQLGTLTVTAKEATITVKSASKNYGESDPAFEGTVNGLINESDLGTVVYTRTNASVNAVGNYEGVLTAEYTENGNYKVTVTPADFEIKALDMSVTAEGYEGIYDGKTHGITVNAPEGAEVIFESGNEFTNVGEYTVKYTVTKEGYNTVEGSSVVKINKKELTIETESLEKVYDGTPLTGSTAMVKGLAASDEGKITAAATGSIINAGSTANTAAVNGDAELLKNYTVLERLGTLTVTAKEATITVKSASKNYGENDPAFEGTVKGLINEGDLGTVVYTRTNKDVNAVGNYPEVLTAEYTENGNYQVTVTPADFEIKALDMSVTAEGYEGIYDGLSHGITVNVPEGAEVTFEKGNEFTDAGNYTVNYKVTKEGYKTVEGSADVKIAKKSITLIAGSASKTYDGTALTTTAYAISEGAIVTGQSIAVTVTGSQIEVGSTSSAISAVAITDSNGIDVTPNYEITKMQGILTINKRSSGGGGKNPGGNNNTTDIIDEEVPLAGVPELNKTDHFNYVKGYEDGTVRPLNNITREEVATIFYRLLTDASRAVYFSQEEDFSDIASSRWSLNAIATLANGKILTGYENGTFGATRPITRAEFAAIASRFDTLEESTDNQFSDVSNHWAKSYINSAAKKGWINGYNDGTFKPDQYITRAEAMTLINRVLERRVDADGLINGYKVFPDNKQNSWYYYQVVEATNNHKYADRENISDMEKWTEILSDKTWNE